MKMALCTLAASLLATSTRAATERYIVSFADGPGARAALRAAGAEVALDLPHQDSAAAHIPEQALAALRNNPSIRSIEEDSKRYPFAETTPYGIPMVQADLVSDANSGNTTLCIIDSGYQIAHEDLQDVNVTGTNDPGTGNWYEDGCGHGTHVAGTVAALTNDVGVLGVNPSGNINLHIIKVFGSDCGWTYSSTLISALDACQAAGANVVSMSLGGNSMNRAEQRAFDSAYADGVLSIAAAGNDGTTASSYPASYDSVVSVAAIDSEKSVADFSQQNSAVELAAPGVGVLSTVPWLAEATVGAGGTDYSANHIEHAAYGSASGTLVDGGLCTSTGSWSGAVVLCERGDISFDEKVTHVQNSGGAAAVVYNNEPGNFLGTLGDGNSSDIVAVSISQEDGLILVGSQLGTTATVASSFDPGASGYEAWAGTSMATPHVSGVAALVWSNFPAATHVEIRNALTATAEDLGAGGRDVAYGFGLVQAKAAFDHLAAGSSCTPTEEPEVSCSDQLDNDCDGQVDGDDADCTLCGSPGDPCSSGADCCSLRCHPRRLTCL